MKALSDWPRPKNNTGIGLHYNTKPAGPPTADVIALWKRMGEQRIKLLANGDDMVNNSRLLSQAGFEIMVRFYAPPINLGVPASDLMKKYAQAGVTWAEGLTNEPEIEWNKPPNATNIDNLARQHIKFADACSSVGLLPLTPAIQGDRVFTWFAPFVARVIALNRRDALEGSAIACHARPANHEPGVPPPGFCFRSYELFDDVIKAALGASLPIFSTEAGYEPGSHEDNTCPEINIDLHSRYGVEMVQMNWRPALFGILFWSWLDDWFESGWWCNRRYGTLPIVKAFETMTKPSHEIDIVVPPPPPPVIDLPIVITLDGVTYRGSVKKDA